MSVNLYTHAFLAYSKKHSYLFCNASGKLKNYLPNNFISLIFFRLVVTSPYTFKLIIAQQPSFILAYCNKPHLMLAYKARMDNYRLMRNVRMILKSGSYV